MTHIIWEMKDRTMANRDDLLDTFITDDLVPAFKRDPPSAFLINQSLSIPFSHLV